MLQRADFLVAQQVGRRVSTSAFLFAGGVMLVFAGEIAAQGVAPPAAGGVLQTVPTPSPQPARPPVIETAPAQPRPIGDIEGLRIEIKSFRIQGLTLVSEGEVRGALVRYLGPGKTFQDLLDAAAAVKKLLAGKGYFLADAVIPEQRIRDGIVVLQVFEGRLGKVKLDVAEDVNIDRPFLAAFLEDLHEGDIIEVGAIERALFLLSDLKGIVIRSVFEPGEKLGTANLAIRVTRAAKADGSVSFDANGSIYTGVLRVGGGLDINSPLGIGDVLNVRLARSLEGNNLEYKRVSYLAPAGSYGTKVGGAVANMDYRLGTSIFESLRASGSAKIDSLIAVHPLIRSRNANLLFSAQHDSRKFTDIQGATGRVTNKEAMVQSFGAAGDFRDGILGGGINVFNLSVTRGNLRFIDPGLAAADRAGRNTGGSFQKANLSYSRLQAVGQRQALYFAVSQQAAGKSLDSSEKLSLGGPNAIRAYPQGEASGDEGYFASLEMRFHVPTETLPGNMVLTGFHDFGWSRINKTTLPSDTIRARQLAGVGIGINWEDAGKWFLRGSISWPMTEAAQSEHVERDPRLFLTFNKNF
jgi:hemolysin activation/secretion protein